MPNWNEVQRGDPPDRVKWRDVACAALGAFLAVLVAYLIVTWH